MIWERRNADWAAMYGINSQLESQHSELHHANQWACQAQLESLRMFEDFTTKSGLYQENQASNCMEIEELRRICHEETERARQLRTGELHAQKIEEPSTMSQLLSQIRTLHDKVNALNELKEFHDPQTASSSGMSHVPSQPSRIPSPIGMLNRDSGLPHCTRNSMGTSGNVFENPPAPERISPYQELP